MSKIALEGIKIDSTSRRYEVRDEEWEKIKGYLEKPSGQKTGRPRNDDRRMLNGILWIARSGAAWRHVPERYGAWNSVYSRFQEWAESGALRQVFKDLSEDEDLFDDSGQ